MNLSINEWATNVHENAVNHGWWDEPRSDAEVIALCHSELSEALEESRAGRPMMYVIDQYNGIEEDTAYFAHDQKPEGVAVEMVDCLIRILDWCAQKGVDVEKVLEIKHRYNVTRPYKHGKAF